MIKGILLMITLFIAYRLGYEVAHRVVAAECDRLGGFFVGDRTFKFTETKMENQHKKITGYRGLSQQEIDLMNEGKALAEQCRQFIEKLQAHPETDKRCVSLGQTNLQQGFMWAIRAVAKPTTF